MNKLKLLLLLPAILLLISSCRSKENQPEQDKVIVAYVTSWTSVMPDPAYVTHINYAFGHVTDSFDGVRIDNEERLRRIVALKQTAPHLKVLLSVGGWGSGRFSEMAADKESRQSFAADCRRIVAAFGLDGIDIDWEYPTSTSADISASPDDTENYTLLMQDIRKAIGPRKLLTLASAASARFIDFRAIDPYVDFINIMTYDMGSAPIHHAPLYRSQYTGSNTAHESVEKHYEAGIPYHKLVLGMPFYGRGEQENFPRGMKYHALEYVEGYERKWDEEAQAPYLADSAGTFVCGYENPRSIAVKCQYIQDKGLLGGMYWEYADDNDTGDLRRAVYNGVIGRPSGVPVKQVLVLTERGGQHGAFTDAALDWLTNEASVNNFTFTEINNTEPVNDAYLSRYDLIIQLDYPPYTWSKEAEEAFIRYIDEGRGGWIGFHHATLLGEFDGYPVWQWFSDFMGGIRFRNYIAPLADGTIAVEDPSHPVMQGVSPTFTLPDDEWYTFDKNPRPNVKVLATVDEDSYSPSSAIRMGDHPAVWINPHKKARNVYFLMGHSKKLFLQKDFNKMFRNAIEWAGDSSSQVQIPEGYPADYASAPRFKALVYYSTQVETAHVDFARDAVEFFRRLNYGDGYILDITTDLSEYPYEKLQAYDIVIWLNNSPSAPEQRQAFEQYMENGGGWMGFHAAAYNDKQTNWPWFVRFMGGGVFYCNNWPPQPVKVETDNLRHPVMKSLPSTFIVPESEWYQWTPGPRENKDVEVLLSISPDNYPLGIKDIIHFGDFPIVWTNKNYRMIYLNMGHGDDEFTDATQKLLFINAFRWIVRDNLHSLLIGE